MRARRASMQRRCSRPRSRASRCSPDRSTSGSAQTTRRPNVRCPGQPEGSRRSRCCPADRDRASTGGSRALASGDRTCCKCARRSPAPADGASPSGSPCTDIEAGWLLRRRVFLRASNRYFELPCCPSAMKPSFYHLVGLTTFAKATVVRRSFVRRRKPGTTYRRGRVGEIFYNGRCDGLPHEPVARQRAFGGPPVLVPPLCPRLFWR